MPASQSRWATPPQMHACRAEAQLVRTVLRTVLTDENISRVLVVANAPRRYSEAREHSLSRKDVQELVENTARLVLAADR